MTACAIALGYQIIRQRQEPFDAADARGLMRMLLHAVAHCHANAIIHRVRFLTICVSTRLY